MSVTFDQVVDLFRTTFNRYPEDIAEIGTFTGSKLYSDLTQKNMIVWNHQRFRRTDGKSSRFKFLKKGDSVKFASREKFYDHFDFHEWGCEHKFFQGWYHYQVNSTINNTVIWVYFLGALASSDREDKAEQVEAVPLYIGKTHDLQGRLSTHRRTQHWWDEVDFVWAVPFCPHDREPDAGTYETMMIHDLRPVYSNQIRRNRKEKKKPPVAIVNCFATLNKTSMNGDDWFEYYTGEMP